METRRNGRPSTRRRTPLQRKRVQTAIDSLTANLVEIDRALTRSERLLRVITGPDANAIQKEKARRNILKRWNRIRIRLVDPLAFAMDAAKQRRAAGFENNSR